MSITGMRNKFQKSLRPIFWALTIVFGIGMVAYFGTGRYGGGAAESAGANDVVLKVGDREFKRALLNGLLTREQTRLSTQPGAQEWLQTVTGQSILRQQVAEQFVDLAIEVAGAEAAGIKVRKREVRDEIETLVEDALSKQRPMDSKGKPMPDREWDRLLREQRRSVAMLRQEFREMFADEDLIRCDLMKKRYEEKLTANLKIGKKQIEDCFAAVGAHQIVVAAKGRSVDQAAQRAKEISGKIAAGGDFVQLAKEYSDDPQAKMSGGDMGQVNVMSQIEEPVREALFALKPGGVSKPIKTEQGYVIVRMDSYVLNMPMDWKDKKRQAEYTKSIRELYKGRIVAEEQKKLVKNSKVERISSELKAYDLLRNYSELMNTGKVEEAKAALKKAAVEMQAAITESAKLARQTGEDTTQSVFNWNLADIYRALEDPKAEIRALENVVGGIEVNQRLANLYEKNGQPQKALARYQEIVPDAWNNAPLLRQVAARLLALGDKKGADKALADAAAREAEEAAIQKQQERQAGQQAPPPGAPEKTTP